MGYWDSINWQKVKKDIEKGWNEGVVAVKKGALVAQKKAGELTDEGKRRYKTMELRTRIHKRVYDLGERIHVLLTGKKRSVNPATDATVKAIMTDIGEMESQIAQLEGRPVKTPRKRTAARQPRRSAKRGA